MLLHQLLAVKSAPGMWGGQMGKARHVEQLLTLRVPCCQIRSPGTPSSSWLMAMISCRQTTTRVGGRASVQHGWGGVGEWR